MAAKALLTVLREEVTVNDFYQAVELLDCEPAHGDVQDEFSEEFAAHKEASQNALISLRNM